MQSRLDQLGIVLFVIGMLLLAFLLRRVFRRIRYRVSSDLKSKPPGRANILLIPAALVSIILAQGLFWMSSQLKYFRPLGGEGALGTVAVEKTGDLVRSLGISYRPSSGDSAAVENSFYLSGDSWRLSGEIVRFKFLREQLRLPEKAYKIDEFNGRFIAGRSPSSTGALLHTQELEGGRSAAFELFRDSKYFKWFAEVDSFASEFVTTEGKWNYDLNIESEGYVRIRYWR